VLLEGKPAIINKYTTVVQEYFQERVKAWLGSVGKNLLGIKHHWLRYEFAPSRGQIHAHMLVICDNKAVLDKCFELKDDNDKLAHYLSSWLSDTVGMTAELDPEWCDLDNSKEAHPSTVKMGSIAADEMGKDVAKCQLSFQKHKCSKFCMRNRLRTKKNETTDEKKRRVCRCGAGIEAHFDQCDTPGFFERNVAAIVRDHRGFDRVDMPRNNRNITQASTYLCQGWRGNCDIQYLIYKSDNKEVDAGDISRVTNYIVSYSCKGNETEVQQKMALKDIVMAASTEYGDERDVKKLARRLLNECSKARVISKQEATCQLAGLELYSCSEFVKVESIAGEHRLGTEKQAHNSLLVRYANRNENLWHMNLYDFFDHCYNKPSDLAKTNWKVKIPLFTGGRCEAVYPATGSYARAVLLLYQPWHGSFTIKSDNVSLLPAFQKFIHDKGRCPKVVRIAYDRAKRAKYCKDPTTKTADIEYDTCQVNPDAETKELVDLVSNFFAEESEDSEDMAKFDFGESHNWSEPSIEVRDRTLQRRNCTSVVSCYGKHKKCGYGILSKSQDMRHLCQT
jgi:hypothetical protein